MVILELVSASNNDRLENRRMQCSEVRCCPKERALASLSCKPVAVGKNDQVLGKNHALHVDVHRLSHPLDCLDLPRSEVGQPKLMRRGTNVHGLQQ